MQNMGTALMGTGEAEGDKRALQAAESAIANPLLGEISMRGAKGLLVSITGSFDMTLYEVEEAASRIRREVDPEAHLDVNIIVGATFDTSLQGRLRVSVVATGIEPGPDLYGLAGPSTESRGRDQRLTDRLSRAAPQQGGQRGEPAKAESAGRLARGLEGGDAQGERRAVIEPKPRQVSDAPPPSARDRQVSFEPLPPSRALRPPRRPLTAQDFPELAGSVPAGSQGAGRSQGRRGFLDWVVGRGRDRGSDSSAFAGSGVSNWQRSAKEDRGEAQPANSQQARKEPLVDFEPGSGAGEPSSKQGARRNGRNPDEAFEIPGFLKKT
jgi:cell division protein FtsZ